jgi:hypothetical protein
MNFILTHENATGKIVLESSVKGIPGIEIYILLQHKITYPKLNMKIISEADGKSILPSHTYSTIHSPGPGLALQ